MSHPLLVVHKDGRHPLTVVLDHPLEIGRETDGLVVDDATVSRRHARFEPVSATRVRVTDLGSSNGTTVGGERIFSPMVAAKGDRIELGDVAIDIEAATPSAQTVRPRARETIVVGDAQALTTSMSLVATAVTTDGIAPELIGVADEPGTLTVVFSDIESSTEQAIALGDTAWFEVLRHHTGLVQAHVVAHRGRIVKNQGDGFMLCFPSARQALVCCIGLQRDLDRMLRDRPDLAVRVRIGMHTGEVLSDDDGDLFGRHVITAARVGAAAQGGEILVSSIVRQIAEPRGDVLFGPAVELDLKGIDESTTVHVVDWRGSPIGW